MRVFSLSVDAMSSQQRLILAVPKGRVGDEFAEWFPKLGITPEPEFFDPDTRKLLFETNRADLGIIRVRSFDVITYVAFGGASMGIVGCDVVAEFDSTEVFAPVDLHFGVCRLSLIRPGATSDAHGQEGLNSVRVATKYPNLTRDYFRARGRECQCIKLNGAIELAAKLGICPMIVDLVSTGRTLAANDLVEVDVLMEVSARLVVNRVQSRTASAAHHAWVEKFREIADDFRHQQGSF